MHETAVVVGEAQRVDVPFLHLGELVEAGPVHVLQVDGDVVVTVGALMLVDQTQRMAQCARQLRLL